jgi:ubiquinone/menaquinone biosynthesis C-methylase UbiE
MDRLVGVPELLDGPLDDRAALVGNLRDLARINRITGGAALSVRAVEDLRALGQVGRVLDIGTGAGDIPVALVRAARRSGRGIRITAIDSRPEVLAAAVVARPGLEAIAEIQLEVADGRALPYPDAAFDVAHASLVLHHLEPAEAIQFLRELRRVATVGVVVNDLVRSRINWFGGWLLVHAIATSRFTRHDGPLSVRRAYTRRELDDLVQRAGLETVAVHAGFADHRIAIAAR